MRPGEKAPLADRLAALEPPVAAEIERVLGPSVGVGPAGDAIELQGLRRKHRVYRARARGEGAGRSIIVKRLHPRAAQRNRLVTTRWLPWIGLESLAPALLGSAAAPGVEWVWQIYEDVGGIPLAELAADRETVAATVDLVAELHTRAVGHPVLAECRRYGEDFGLHHFTANVGDARTALDALRPPVVRPSTEQAKVRDRLLGRLDRLLADVPRRARLMAEAAGPDTMLHGDLWISNVLVTRDGGGIRVRLIDWDHAGAGPVSYDLSTLLLRFPAAERGWMLDRYRDAVARAGWRLPAVPVLNALFDTAECARCADRIIWPAIALLEGGDWGWVELAAIEGWFAALEPALPE